VRAQRRKRKSERRPVEGHSRFRVDVDDIKNLESFALNADEI
jgi:hypothetical protein